MLVLGGVGEVSGTRRISGTAGQLSKLLRIYPVPAEKLAVKVVLREQQPIVGQIGFLDHRRL
ncbi:hypothetical protein D3C76_1828040 [compost metagenome]